MALPLASPTFIHGLSSSSTFHFFPETLTELIFIFLTRTVKLKYGHPSRYLVSWQWFVLFQCELDPWLFVISSLRYFCLVFHFPL